MSSTHQLLLAHGHASRVARHSLSGSLLGPASSLFRAADLAAVPFASTGCGASGTIADKSGFEDTDANLAIDKAGCMDWNGFAPVTWTGSVPYQSAAKTVGVFTFFGSSDAVADTDSMYGAGVKQADTCPATGPGQVNVKSDLARIYGAVSTDPVTKHVFLDLALVRAPLNTTSADVHVAFEFNQSKTPCGGSSGVVQRTKGDILLGYDLNSGVATILYSQWTGSTWTAAVTLPASIAEASFFTGTSTTDGIKPSNGLDPNTDEFGEAGIDLTAATSGLGNDGRACEQFGTVIGESRSSGSSTSAEMKDLVGPANINVSNCVTPSLTTTQQPASGAIGDTFKDKATLSGANTPDGTGKITFKLYSAAGCGGSVLDTETVSNINANSGYTTPTGFQLTNAGTYYWVASFSGDGYNNQQTTGCNDEPVVVAKNQPSIVTTQQPASGAIGDTFKDKATLSGAANLKGTGAITFTLYSAADCGGSVLDTETVNNINANSDYTTPTGFAIQNAGTYYWVASFNGDANNKSFTSACNDEPVVVAKNQPSIVTTQQPASGAIGDTFKDKATLSGGANYAATGAITFTLYSAAGCGGSVLDTESVSSISANSDYTTPTGFAIQNAGTYYWVASFNGDANNKSFTSGCNDEPVVVGKNQPSIVTTQQPEAGAIGALYKDTATLSDAASLKGTGAITFTLYSAADCGGSVLDTEVVNNISANDDYTTPTGFHIANAGNYYWVASFNGDANNKAFTSGCNDEPVGVGENATSIVTTQQPASGAIGDLYKDKATLSGGVNYDGTGSITFKLYGKADCGGAVLDTEVVNSISANDDYTTPAGFHIHNAGTYYWVALFSGDANNAPFTSACNDEPVVVGKNQPSIVTTQQPASGSVSDTYNDTATLSDGVNYTGTGSITFTLYSAADCGGSVVDTESVSNISANDDYTTPTGVQLNSAGTYYWVASFSGDANNQSFTSGCNDEPVVVNGADIHIVKKADDTSVNAGDQIGFTLTVSNSGAGDAYGVNVSDVLPTNLGLDWTIKSQGLGWGNGASQCAIVSGTLSCGPVTVPAGTTPDDSTFTVHIISTTTAKTGVASCDEGTGNVNNTGHVKTSNDGSDDSSAYVCVLAPAIHIVKTADNAAVMAGTQIGFTLTVSNSGAGDAYGVNVSDLLPANPGLDWQIDSQGTGWGNAVPPKCAIVGGKLSCGPVTVPAGTTQENSTFTVHIISPTTLLTGVASCDEGTGNVNNTGHVTTSNDGSDDSSAYVCVQGETDLSITKTGSPATQDVPPPFQNITWTMDVKNNGGLADTNVAVDDPMPAGNTYVSSEVSPSTAGSCNYLPSTLTLHCDLGTMQPGDKVEITLVTHPTVTGEQVNTAVVSGALPETDTTNNSATATVLVNGPAIPPACTAVAVTPKQLYAGRKTKMHIKVTEGSKAMSGVRVRIKGPGISAITNKSNAKGKITKTIKPKKAGVITFRPVVKGTACGVPRVGITGVFTPPVTG